MSKDTEFKLLTREQFRELSLARDKHTCVVCGAAATEVHHILERRLFPSGGYYLENGASVCNPCHIRCEQTLISPEELREACGITRVCVPDELYPDQKYDKWGNGILANGQRTRGPLFEEENVQKVLRSAGVLESFTNQVKFPRIFHVPWSPGIQDDDRVIPSMDSFKGQRVIVTEKMDGENTTLYTDHFHARSVDGRSHFTQDRAKAEHAKFAHDIPPSWRVNVENMFAAHSIRYEALPSVIMGFAIWNEKNVRLSWAETLVWFELLGIPPVRVLYDGIYDETIIRGLYSEAEDWHKSEGYVIWLAKEFHFSEFHKSVAKYVRKGHVQTDKHWKFDQSINPNGFLSD